MRGRLLPLGTSAAPYSIPRITFSLTQILGLGSVSASNVGKPRSGPSPAFATGMLTSGSVCGPPLLCPGRHAALKKNPVPRCPRALSPGRDADLTCRPPSLVWGAPLD
ncbi:hypothetical protein NDU88_004656 [Pleurodeles waltl]|uniref:Uncharacterized protein n=1 Tax=Pleurodeles waltl TaxID=8319 RepID=A0AAV7N225_PLEWA|nr:hypothetical protein NDU88_004656 [Pleurodeles waltl]